MFFKYLPDEIVLKIFNGTSEQDLNQLSLVDSHCNRLAKDTCMELAMAMALKKAVLSNNIKRTKELLLIGGNCNYIYEKNKLALKCDGYYLSSSKTLLNASIGRNFFKIAFLLLEAGAKFDIPSEYGYTSLHVAAFYGRASIGKLLINYGADHTIRDIRGKKPADTARINQASPELIQALQTNLDTDWENALWYEKGIWSKCYII